MKTSDVSSNRPVQKDTGQNKAEAKKPQKEFKEVLERSDGKPAQAGKKKSFSPLGHMEKKQIKQGKQHAGLEAKEGKEEKRVEAKHDRSEMEALSEAEMGEGKSKKSALSPEEAQVQPNMQAAGAAGAAGPQGAGKLEHAAEAAGLKMEELQSIVQKVQVGVNELGKPEMDFQIQTHNLGPMDLKVSADGDKIKIDFVTEDLNAEKVLKENLNELSEQLRDKGLILDQTNFSTRDQEKQEQQQQQQEQAWEGPMYSNLPTGQPKKRFNL